MSRTLLPLAGFAVTFNGRFWVTAEAKSKTLISSGAKASMCQKDFKMRKPCICLLLLSIAVVCFRDTAVATTFSFTGLCRGAGCNETESAQAVFTLNDATDTITIQINNLLADPKSDIQTINALSFAIDQGLNATLNPGATATLLTNVTHSSFSSQLAQSTGWGLFGSAGNFTLCAVNTGWQLLPARPHHYWRACRRRQLFQREFFYH
jgi:hypothetical protein